MASDCEGTTPPHMELTGIRFVLMLPEYRENVNLKNRLLAGIISGNMAPYYLIICKDLGWEIDETVLATMIACNKEKLDHFEELQIKDNVTDDELEPKIWNEKLDYLCSIGDKENATILATAKSKDKSLSVNRRLDSMLALFRIAFFHGCNLREMKSALDNAKALVKAHGGGDWSARNKLKAYEAICCLGFREYEQAANLFMDSLPTFESYELATFDRIVSYALVSAMIVFPRSELRDKLTKGGTLSQALKSNVKEANEYFESLYDCRYADFFKCLAKVEGGMRMDPLLHSHYHHYVREMRLRAYRQILAAYQSLSLQSMATAFGVSEEYIEKEVARFTAAGRLQCKIDLVAGVVITGNLGKEFPGDGSAIAPTLIHARGELYQSTIRCGDNLLNRVKKLSRITDF